MGSLGSSDPLPDTDSELDEGSHSSSRLMKQESVVSTEDEQLSYRDSLDLSGHSATHTDPEQDTEQDLDIPEGDGEGEPPAVPESAPPEEDTAAAEQEVTTSLAELNVNQSNNNNQLSSPIASLSGVPLACLCRKNLPLTRRRNTEPEFV